MQQQGHAAGACKQARISARAHSHAATHSSKINGGLASFAFLAYASAPQQGPQRVGRGRYGPGLALRRLQRRSAFRVI